MTWKTTNEVIEEIMIGDLVERLRDGCRQCGEADDGSIELFDIEGANDLMDDAAEAIESASALVIQARVVLDRLVQFSPDHGVDEFLDAINDARLLVAKIDGAE